MPTQHDPLARLLGLLDLEPIDRDSFRGSNPGEGGRRVFGGQVASQALRAAASTVEAEHHPNSLHAYFLRPGRHGPPITYTVDRIRDGTSFTTRRVVALQEGEAILNLDASFHKHEEGGEHSVASPLGALPDPESLAPDRGRGGRHQQAFDRRAVELSGEAGAVQARWVRARGVLPDDPVLHACVIVYMSDSGPVGTARRAIGGSRRGDGSPALMTASLDHCVWFHRPARADEWLLYRLEAIVCGRARGLSRGEIWSVGGELVASVAQEALLRQRAR